jgi:sirohydrochlorin ferrochelatase
MAVPIVVKPKSLLLVAHGTRQCEGVAEIRALAASVAERLAPAMVEVSFLEFESPDIDEALAQMALRGATEVHVVPLLLFAAGHALVDIPAALRRAVTQYPRLHVSLAPAFNCSPELLALTQLRCQEALAGDSPVSAEQTALVLVGRGSKEPDANAEMARFARLAFERSGLGWLEVCFTALAEPRLEPALEVIARMPFQRFVVQPHLLFRGELSERVSHEVARVAKNHSGEWRVAGHLGPHELLVEAVVRQADMCSPFVNG